MKIIKVLICLLLTNGSIFSQEFSISNVQLPQLEKSTARKVIYIPNILGYETLKCDFHMHTVFSDGSQWPTVRVEEAWREGLDAISITDHIERQPSKKYIGGDKNASYELAKNLAEEKGIILIAGGEVTRSMPPGHLNAIFLSDVNILDKESWHEALQNAKNDGAFIMWNHPGWKAQQPDTCLWMPEHEELYKNNMIHAIEVFNEKEWYPIALDWCMEKGLAPVANSDIHGVAEYYYDYNKFLRPMTLVFAKNRTEASIKEALFAGRTVAFFANILAGQEKFLKVIFLKAVSAKEQGNAKNDNLKRLELTNNSDIPFILEMHNSKVELKPHTTSAIIIEQENENSEIKVINLLTGSKSCIKATLPELLVKQ